MRIASMNTQTASMDRYSFTLTTIEDSLSRHTIWRIPLTSHTTMTTTAIAILRMVRHTLRTQTTRSTATASTVISMTTKET
jgi:hypothetical protein